MKKIYVIGLILITVAGLFATELIIYKTNGDLIVTELDEISSFYFTGEQATYLQLVAVPTHLDWVGESGSDVLVTELHLTLVDANDEPMENEEIIFSSTLGSPENGEFSYFTDEDGSITLGWQFGRHECPIYSPYGPGITTSTIAAQIVGSNIQRNTTIILYRYEN